MGLETSLCESPSRQTPEVPFLPSVIRSAGRPKWLFWWVVWLPQIHSCLVLLSASCWSCKQHKSGDEETASLLSDTICKTFGSTISKDYLLEYTSSFESLTWWSALLLFPVKPSELHVASPWGSGTWWLLKNEKQNTINISDRGFGCFIFIRLPRRQ